MAPEREQLGNLKDPKVLAVLNARTVSERKGDVLEKLEVSLASRIGLSNDYRLAFHVDPSESRWVVSRDPALGDVVTGFVKPRNAPSGEGPRYSEFKIPLDKVSANGTVHEIYLNGMKVTEPSQNPTLVRGMVTISEHSLRPYFYAVDGKQKGINYVGAKPDGSLIILNESDPQRFGNEGDRRVDVIFVKGKDFGKYTAQFPNFERTHEENKSEKRTVKVFDGHGKQVGELTVNFALVPLKRDSSIVSAITNSSKGEGKEIQRDVPRKASDGKIVSVTLTENGAAAALKDLAK
jgi:hypothetical protein